MKPRHSGEALPDGEQQRRRGGGLEVEGRRREPVEHGAVVRIVERHVVADDRPDGPPPPHGVVGVGAPEIVVVAIARDRGHPVEAAGLRGDESHHPAKLAGDEADPPLAVHQLGDRAVRLDRFGDRSQPRLLRQRSNVLHVAHPTSRSRGRRGEPPYSRRHAGSAAEPRAVPGRDCTGDRPDAGLPAGRRHTGGGRRRADRRPLRSRQPLPRRRDRRGLRRRDCRRLPRRPETDAG